MNPETINTVHIGAYVDNVRQPSSSRRVCTQTADGYILDIQPIRHDDTHHYRLGERSAGFVALCRQGLELVVVHPGKVKNHPLETQPIEEFQDLRDIARGIAEFKGFHIAVRYDETPLELDAPKNYDESKR